MRRPRSGGCGTGDIARLAVLLKMGWLLRSTLLVAALGILPAAPFPARAARCDCRPHFPVEAEGTGVCSVVIDDSRWCKIKFGTAGTAPGESLYSLFLDTLRKYGLTLYDSRVASAFVQEVPLARWTVRDIWLHFPALVAVAVWDVSPSRLPALVNVIKESPGVILDGMVKSPVGYGILNYNVGVEPGRLTLREGDFSVALVLPISGSAIRPAP